MKTDRTSRRSFLTGSMLLSASAFATFCFGQRGGGHAQAAAPDANWKAQIDQIIADMMQQDGVPGVMLAVVKQGEAAYRKGYGVKRSPGGAVPDENTVFYIGSLSKAITAVGAMLLVQEGKLDLNAVASRYISELPRAWHGITVKQFMSHTSGIPELSSRKKNSEADISAVYALMADLPMQSEPGTKQRYNNFNYAVTGNVIERISNLSYIDYMTRRVFTPLGMDHSGVGIISPENHATGYLQGENGQMTETEPKIASFGVPSGGLETNLADLLKFEASLRSHTLLKPQFFQQMITPVQGFGATPGWFTRKAGGVTVVSKNGAAGGFSSFFSFVPDSGHAVIMLRNVQGKGIGIQAPSNAILNACCGIPKNGGAAAGEEK